MSYQIVSEVANNGISGTIERVVVHKNSTKKFVCLPGDRQSKVSISPSIERGVF